MYIRDLHNKNRLFFFRLLLELSCFLLIGWLAIALISYYKYDPSFLYYTTENAIVKNSAGMVGAQVGALLFYLFGGACYALLVSLLFSWMLMIQRKPIAHIWEKVVALCVLPFIGAGLLAAYSVDCTMSMFPGGAIGKGIYSWISGLFGEICGLIFLHIHLIIFLFMMTPYVYIISASCLIRVNKRIYNFIRDYKIVQHSYKAVMYIMNICLLKPMQWLYHFTANLISGKLFDATDLVIPDNATPDISALIELHQLLQHTKDTSIQGARIEKQSSADFYDIDNDIDNLIENKNEMLSTSGFSSDAALPDSIDNELFIESQIMPIDTKKIYQLPSVDLFIGVVKERHDENLKQLLQERAQLLEKKLERFGVIGSVVAIKRGPVVTLFEYLPHMDTKLSKIVGLEDDLAMALQALSIRIIAPIPGTAVVGFEVANSQRTDVMFSSIIKTEAYTQFKGGLPLVLGQDTVGKEVIVDLARMPHLLIAGSTGSGKSVALNVMLISLLCKLSPTQLKLVLIDPKRLEFMSYADIGHLLFPIVTDPKKVVHILRWVVHEMEERYQKMAELGVRHLFDYNEKIKNAPTQLPLPFIVVVIDELSDLMLTVGRDIEDLITRITQMARAAGIHMMVATQRPSVDVITGLIKVNFPSRISFRVTSRIDSRTILDCNGADKLLGRGDMLFLDAVHAQLNRVHGAFVSTAEIEKVVSHIRAQGPPVYLLLDELYGSDKQNGENEDELYQQVVLFLQETDDISISLLQRKFRIGYNRSARIIDMLESHGLIMPLDGSKTRKVIR